MQVMRWLPLLVFLAAPSLGAAQVPAYDAAALRCARFSESVHGALESSFGPQRRLESLGREGVLVVRATPDSAGLSVESWYDTLAVWREGPDGRYAPDAEGILGGRYVGILDPQGDYLATVTPYVPAALRDIFDFARVRLHFFPPLSPAPLRPGGEWTDGAGLTIWRLADSAATAGPVGRYRWIRRESWEEGVAAGDSTVIVHRGETEDGSLLWREGSGPVGWSSSTVATLELDNGAGRSELTQDVLVRRLAGACPGP